MDRLTELLPSVEDGYLPYYLLLVSIAAIGNSLQNLATLHYTRRIYNGQFIPNPAQPPHASPDSVHKLVPHEPRQQPDGQDHDDDDKYSPASKAADQVTPLAARLFGVYTLLAGLVRLYHAFRVRDPSLYQLCLLTHLVAAAHFTSEILVFRTLRLRWEHAFPLAAAFGGSVWMAAQYSHYVGA